jgi:hypothetical protein
MKNQLAEHLLCAALAAPQCAATAAHAQEKPGDYPNKPGILNYGSQGPGTTGHIGMERFKLMAGIEIVHVPYKGAAPALMDLLAAQILAAFASARPSPPILGERARVRGVSKNPVFYYERKRNRFPSPPLSPLTRGEGAFLRLLLVDLNSIYQRIETW